MCMLTFWASAPVTATMRRIPFAIASSETMTNGAAWPEFCRWLQITESNNRLTTVSHNCGRQLGGGEKTSQNKICISEQHQRLASVNWCQAHTRRRIRSRLKVSMKMFSALIILSRQNLCVLSVTWHPVVQHRQWGEQTDLNAPPNWTKKVYSPPILFWLFVHDLCKT